MQVHFYSISPALSWQLRPSYELPASSLALRNFFLFFFFSSAHISVIGVIE